MSGQVKPPAAIAAVAAAAIAAVATVMATPHALAQQRGTTAAPAAASSADVSLHPLVARFIDGWNAGDAAAMEAVFAANAVLIDDKRRFQGRDGMRGFLQSEARDYRVRILEVQERRIDGMKLLVTVSRVGGGAGFRATFDFTIAGDRIMLANLQYA